MLVYKMICGNKRTQLDINIITCLGAGGSGSGSAGKPDAQPSSSAAEGQLPQSSAPAFLLVHGFGAFGEQWRGQIKALTAAGYQVHCQAGPPSNVL